MINMTLIKNKKLSEFGKKGVTIRWKRHHKNISDNLKNKNKFNHLLLKARLCGFLAGDGTVKIRVENKRKNATHYEIYFYPDHPSLIKAYLEAFTELYGKKPLVKNEGNYYRVRTQCKVTCLDLLKVCKFGVHSWTVPFNFLTNDKLKKEWLRAFFDCESYVGKKVVQLQSVNKKGLNQINNILKEFGIESKIYKYKRKNKNWNINYILCIMKEDARRAYLDKIGFNHDIKLTKLKKQF